MRWRIPALILIGICSGWLGVWSADRSPPAIIKRMTVLTPQVKPGGELRIEFEVEHRGTCPLHVEHYLIDAKMARTILPDLDFATIPTDDVHVEKYTLPMDFAPGKGCYRRISSYTCNPVQRWFAPIIIDRPPACFEVVTP